MTNMTKVLDLLPCPFCGGSPDLTDYFGNYNKARPSVHCENCDLSLDGYNTPEEAVKRWNTRAVASDHVRDEPDWWRWRYMTPNDGWSKWIALNTDEVPAFRDLQFINLDAGKVELQPLFTHPSPDRPASGPMVPWELKCQHAPECDCPAASDQGAVREALKSARSEFERQLHKCRSDGDADYFEKELTKINEAIASILPERSAPAIGTPDAREALERELAQYDQTIAQAESNMALSDKGRRRVIECCLDAQGAIRKFAAALGQRGEDGK